LDGTAAPPRPQVRPRSRPRCRLVANVTEAAEHHRVRQAVFVDEQGVFAVTDLDAHDARPDVLHAVAWLDDRAVGAVRLFPCTDRPGWWQGDRLAVLP